MAARVGREDNREGRNDGGVGHNQVDLNNNNDVNGIVLPRYMKAFAFIIATLDLIWPCLLWKFTKNPERTTENNLIPDRLHNNISKTACWFIIFLFCIKTIAGATLLPNVVLSNDPTTITSRLRGYICISFTIFLMLAMSCAVAFTMGGIVPFEMVAMACARFQDTILLHGFLKDLDRQAGEWARDIERVQLQRDLRRVQQRIERLLNLQNNRMVLQRPMRAGRNEIINPLRN